MEYNFFLFNAITDTLEILEEAKHNLIEAQKHAEDIYIESEPKPYLFIFRSLATDEVGILRSNSLENAKALVFERLSPDYEVAQVPNLPFWHAEF